MDRAKTRDPAIEADIDALYADNERSTSTAAFLIDSENYGPAA